MNRTTTGLCLAALLVSCSMNSVLQADELIIKDDYFIADETRHQWINEHNGRTCILLVSGALLSSPCTLETNEVMLPLPEQKEGIMTRYMLKLNLLGCGEGGSLTYSDSPGGRESMMVVQSALLTGVEGGGLQPGQRMVSTGRAIVYGGANQFTYYLSEAQQQALAGQQAADRAQGKPYMNPRDNRALLRLRLDYE
ncbi:pilus-assembly fibrillin subunit [Escherichia coli]|uniref:pilus-assembly fibrillin subunit n=1 Tax=Escherichia coli TaxID=562 RepID=UPI0006A65267|nr:pilus-assembly fibrillin subunit [Escherichia coli]